MKEYVILLIVLFMMPRLQAQDSLCLCKNENKRDVSPAGIMISHVHDKNQWMLSYRYMGNSMNDIFSGNKIVDKEKVYDEYLMSPDRMKMDMHMLMVMYGLTNKITLMGMWQYNYNTMDMIMPSGGTHQHGNGIEMKNDPKMKMSGSGFGDTKFNILYSIIKNNQHQVMLIGGLSIPTGSIFIKGERESMYSNQRLPYHMQLGSGTWDLLPGINYLYQNASITWSSQLASVIRPHYNSVGYRYGNEATLNNWIAIHWTKSISTSLRLEGSASGIIHGRDQNLYYRYEPAANPYNYGGQRINGYGGINYSFKRGFLKNNRLGIEYGVPFYQNLYGTQLASQSSIYGSWSLSF